MHTTTSLEQVSKMFQTWRESKLSKFEPTPNSLKILIKQLLPLHSKSEIMQSLSIGSRLLNAIIKPVRRRTKKQNKHNSQTNTNLHVSSRSPQDVSFMPFTFGEVSGSTSSDRRLPSPHKKDQYPTQCEIIKPNGIRLSFSSSSTNLSSIIKAFICSN